MTNCGSVEPAQKRYSEAQTDAREVEVTCRYRVDHRLASIDPHAGFMAPQQVVLSTCAEPPEAAPASREGE